MNDQFLPMSIKKAAVEAATLSWRGLKMSDYHRFQKITYNSSAVSASMKMLRFSAYSTFARFITFTSARTTHSLHFTCRDNYLSPPHL
jgi:hypothetical protein